MAAVTRKSIIILATTKLIISYLLIQPFLGMISKFQLLLGSAHFTNNVSEPIFSELLEIMIFSFVTRSFFQITKS